LSEPAYCVKCGNILPSESKFCPKCGTSINSPISQDNSSHVREGTRDRPLISGKTLAILTGVGGVIGIVGFIMLSVFQDDMNQCASLLGEVGQFLSDAIADKCQQVQLIMTSGAAAGIVGGLMFAIGGLGLILKGIAKGSYELGRWTRKR